MNCQRVQESFVDDQAGLLSVTEAVAVRGHLVTCPACEREWAGLRQTWQALGQLPAEAPGPRLRAQFRSWLEDQRRELREPRPFVTMRSRLDHIFAAFMPARPALQGGLAVALFALGLLMGARFFPAAATVDAATAKELARLHAKVDSMGELVGYSLLQQRSTSERLKNVLATLELKAPDQRVLSELVGALALDASTNVRLSALEALYRHADHPGVSARVRASLEREPSPLVQVAMIDFLVAAHDRAATPALATLARNESLDPAVRDAARRALAQL